MLHFSVHFIFSGLLEHRAKQRATFLLVSVVVVIISVVVGGLVVVVVVVVVVGVVVEAIVVFSFSMLSSSSEHLVEQKFSLRARKEFFVHFWHLISTLRLLK